MNDFTNSRIRVMNSEKYYGPIQTVLRAKEAGEADDWPLPRVRAALLVLPVCLHDVVLNVVNV
jgi:hypothetical protein